MAGPARVVIGRIGRPHGLRGELRVEPETDFPQRLLALKDAVLEKNGRAMLVRVGAARTHGTAVLLKLEGIDSAEAAAAWRHGMLTVPREQAVPLPPGQYYIFDVLGLQVQTEDGAVLGTVAEVLRTGSNDVYVVRGAGREVLIPAIGSVVRRIDPAAGRLVIRPMDGMME